MHKNSPQILHAAWAFLITITITTGCSHQAITTSNQPPARAIRTETPDPTEAVPPQVQQILRIKAGQSIAFTDSSGNVWQADQGFADGDTIERPDVVIASTKDPGLYQSEHYGMSSFSCKLPNGKYTAKLHFAETYEGITGPGERVFSFNVQGHEVKDFDVWAKAGGPNRAYIERVPVEITNGQLKITFTSNIENPQINAIEIIPAS
jgi:hypothetical protein